MSMKGAVGVALLISLCAGSLPASTATCPMARDTSDVTRISPPDCCANQKCPMLQKDTARPPAALIALSPIPVPAAVEMSSLPAPAAVASSRVAVPRAITSPPRLLPLRI